MIKWKDITSYSKYGEKVPTSWELKAGNLRISITCGHIHYKGQWIMHCSPFFDTYPLKVETKEEAQQKAIQLVSAELNKVMQDLATIQE